MDQRVHPTSFCPYYLGRAFAQTNGQLWGELTVPVAGGDTQIATHDDPYLHGE
jgi:hypothetical protein